AAAKVVPEFVFLRLPEGLTIEEVAWIEPAAGEQQFNGIVVAAIGDELFRLVKALERDPPLFGGWRVESRGSFGGLVGHNFSSPGNSGEFRVAAYHMSCTTLRGGNLRFGNRRFES